MPSLTSFLTSLGLTVPTTGRSSSRRVKPPTAAQRRAVEAASVKHLPGPSLRLAAPTRPPTAAREGLPTVTKDTTTYKWTPTGRVSIRPGIPADLGLVGKPLTDRKITKYEAQGKYGPEAKKAREDVARAKAAKKHRKTRYPSLDALVEGWLRGA